ncbi:MAG: DUF3667 domain-containing protein [Rhodothermales bacterium]
MLTAPLSPPDVLRDEPEQFRPETCPNCEAERLGDYCQRCGQHYLDGRLTLGTLWSEFAERFLKMERGLGLTVRTLTVAPGRVCRRYVAGERKRYVSPLSYFVLGTAVVLFAFSFQIDGMKEWMIEMMERGDGTPLFGLLPADKVPEFVELNLKLIGVTYAYQVILLYVPFVLFMRLFFRRSGFNLAEISVYALFVTGHYHLIDGLLSLPLLAFTGSATPPWLTIMLSLFFLCFGAVGFFGGRVGTAFKTIGAYVLAYLMFGIIRDGALLLWVLST